MREYQSFIDGKWLSDNAVGTIDVIDPSTEEVIGRVVDGGPKQAAMAIEAARRAFDDGPWPWMSVRERAMLKPGKTRSSRISTPEDRQATTAERAGRE